jgi:hypothetical protein
MYFILRTSFLGSLNLTVIPKLRVAERLRITLPTVDNTPRFPVGQRLLSGDGLDQSSFRWPYAARRTDSAAWPAPGSAGNNARDTDIPRRLRIRARQCWNPSVTDVIVNARRDVGGHSGRNSPRVHDALETAFTISGICTQHRTSTRHWCDPHERNSSKRRHGMKTRGHALEWNSSPKLDAVCTLRLSGPDRRPYWMGDATSSREILTSHTLIIETVIQSMALIALGASISSF